MMDFLMDNWFLIVAALAVIATVAFAVRRFAGLPTEEQLQNVREWLLGAVTEAEKELGSGTGKLKLRQVYDAFLVRFPWLAKVLTFDTFSGLVDDALEEMREMLKNNVAVQAHVEGDPN